MRLADGRSICGGFAAKSWFTYKTADTDCLTLRKHCNVHSAKPAGGTDPKHEHGGTGELATSWAQ
jgi:hypothetical protein